MQHLSVLCISLSHCMVRPGHQPECAGQDRSPRASTAWLCSGVLHALVMPADPRPSLVACILTCNDSMHAHGPADACATGAPPGCTNLATPQSPFCVCEPAREARVWRLSRAMLPAPRMKRFLMR